MLALWRLVPRTLQRVLAAVAFVIIGVYLLALLGAIVIGGMACCGG